MGSEGNQTQNHQFAPRTRHPDGVEFDSFDSWMNRSTFGYSNGVGHSNTTCHGSRSVLLVKSLALYFSTLIFPNVEPEKRGSPWSSGPCQSESRIASTPNSNVLKDKALPRMRGVQRTRNNQLARQLLSSRLVAAEKQETQTSGKPKVQAPGKCPSQEAQAERNMGRQLGRQVGRQAITRPRQGDKRGGKSGDKCDRVRVNKHKKGDKWDTSWETSCDKVRVSKRRQTSGRQVATREPESTSRETSPSTRRASGETSGKTSRDKVRVSKRKRGRQVDRQV